MRVFSGTIHRLQGLTRRRFLSSSTRLVSLPNHSSSICKHTDATPLLHNPYPLLSFLSQQRSRSSPRFSTTSSADTDDSELRSNDDDEITEDEESDGWEEEEELEAKLGDGGDGGGIVLQGVAWGERVLALAHEVLSKFPDDLELYAFKATSRGYVYVRLDKLSNEYGCPAMEELENYCQEYKKRLEEVGALGEIPDNLALEVSSPGAERILRVPDDLSRFKDMPMRVTYVENAEKHGIEKDGIFLLDSIGTEQENCVWKLANVKENRDPESKGRPISRKRKDWRLNLPFTSHRRVTLYLEF